MATSFYLGARPDKSGDLPIIVSISVRGQRLLTSLGYSIAPDKWDADEQRVRRGCWNSRKISHSIINARIKAISSRVAEFEVLTKERPSRSVLSSLLDEVKGRRGGPAGSNSVADCLDEFISHGGMQQQWTAGTIVGMRSFAKHLREYNPSSLESLDGDGANRFLNYLRTECGMRESTVRKNYSCLRWFLQWAHRKGYYHTLPFTEAKPKFKIVPNPLVFLNDSELDALFNLEIPSDGAVVAVYDYEGGAEEITVSSPDTLRRVRDVFCLCCATSLRFSDVARLRKTDIGEDAIRMTTKKTATPLTIELNPMSRDILGRYRDFRHPKGLALPVVDSKRMNIHLRTLCRLAGINEPVTRTYYRGGERVDETAPKWALVTTHAARRTFICRALAHGVPPQIVMKWTGHSDYKSMRPYIDVAGAERQNAMRKIFGE